MKCSALNVDFNGVKVDPLGWRSPPYACIKFGSPIHSARFLLLSTSDFFRDLRLPHTFQEWTASKSLEIDKDSGRMNFSALSVDFNSASYDPIGTKSHPYECIKFGYPLQNLRFLLLSTNLARERLQIDKNLPRIITSTADELFGGTNIDDLERPWTQK